LTLDTMHIFLCGLSTYLLSWLTDALIPGQIPSWDVLNRAFQKHPQPKGEKIPLLERRDGSGERSAKRLRLTAAETMRVAICR
jgi:hypothetical protein